MKDRYNRRTSKFLFILIAIAAVSTSATFAGNFNSVAPRESGYEILPIAPVTDDNQSTRTIFDNDANTNAVIVPKPPFVTAVPEPTTVAMMVLGAGLLGSAQRFRRKVR